MGEPLSNLDARLREEVRDEIRTLTKKLGITVMYVTHDQIEAMALADRIAVMSEGKILQIGAARELYHAPSKRSVGSFLGAMNEFQGSAMEDGNIRTELGILRCAQPSSFSPEVFVAIRPEDVEVSITSTGAVNEFQAEVVSLFFLGDMTVCGIASNGTRFRGKMISVDRGFDIGS